MKSALISIALVTTGYFSGMHSQELGSTAVLVIGFFSGMIGTILIDALK